MDIETLTTMNDQYRIAVMLLEGFTLIVGLASAMFMLVAIVCAAWDSLVAIGRSALGKVNPALRTHSCEEGGPVAGLEYAFDSGVSRRESSAIQ